jgi:hypothetical protein
MTPALKQAYAESLDSIGIRNKTDKASQFSRTYAKPHDYLRHLELFFEPLRDNPIKLLEIGVGGGESIRTWLEYFKCVSAYGVDIVSNTNEWNTPGHSVAPYSYTFSHGDQSSSVFWKSFIAKHGGDWDIIIDDGSHLSADIMGTFNALWPHVKSGGLYEIEDLGTAVNADQWLRQTLTPLHGNRSELDSIYFARELAILKKK